MESQENSPLYLYQAGEQREACAAWRLMNSSAGGLLMQALEVPWPAGWCLLKVPRPAPGVGPGDIDIIAGKTVLPAELEKMNLDEIGRWWMKRSINGPRKWTFSNPTVQVRFDRLIGFEIKCAFVTLDPSSTPPKVALKSGKGGRGKMRRLKGQLEAMLDAGLDHVVMLDIVAGVPMDAKTVPDAIAWGAVTTCEVDRSHPRKSDNLFPDLPIGHFEVSIAPNLGSTEEAGGMARISPLRRPIQNPRLRHNDVREKRELLIRHVHDLLQAAASKGQISGLPIVLTAHAQKRRS